MSDKELKSLHRRAKKAKRRDIYYLLENRSSLRSLSLFSRLRRLNSSPTLDAKHKHSNESGEHHKIKLTHTA